MSAPQPGTPLPWKQGSDPAVDHKIYGPYCIVDCSPGGEKNRNAANAAYIVHAANNYPKAQALADALRRITVLRPAGDVATAANARQLVQQMEAIALSALAAWDAKP